MPSFFAIPFRAVTAAGAVLCIGLAGTAASAQEITFKGKRLDAIIGSSPGGGTDGTTRLVGRFFEKYLPGNPSIVYRNMPAGRGVQALNYFSKQARRDGTSWTGGSSSYVDPNNLRKPMIEYNPLEFGIIGGVGRGGSVVSVRRSKIPNLTDPSKEPVIIGTVDGSRSWEQMLLWGKDKLDWNLRFVIGYPGAPALLLAARRGEVDAFGTSTEALLRSLQKNSDLDPFIQIGETADGKVVPRATFPDVPIMADVLGDKLAGEAGEAFDFWVKTNQIDKWYALPPGTPQEILAVYRTAFSKLVKDPEFDKIGRHQFGEDFAPQTGDEVLALFRVTTYPNPQILSYMAKMAERHGLPAEPLSDAEVAKLAKERGLLNEMKAVSTLDAVNNDGRELLFKADDGSQHKVEVSGNRTKVVVAGKESKRGDLKMGMSCEISYAGNNTEASAVVCK